MRRASIGLICIAAAASSFALAESRRGTRRGAQGRASSTAASSNSIAVGATITDLVLQSNGQSISRGGSSTNPLSTTQPFDSVRSSGSPLPLLIETGVESHVSASINGLRALDLSGRRYVAGTSGVSGATWELLRPGNTAWDNFVAVYTSMQNEIPGYLAPAMAWIHGHSNSYLGCDGGSCGNGVYAGYLYELQSLVTSAVRAANGQAMPTGVFIIQTHSWSVQPTGTPDVGLEQYRAAKAHPLIFAVGPKYHLGTGIVSIYNPNLDGTHLSNEGYNLMGAYFARAYHETIILDRPWEPLWPTSITASGSLITACYSVPCERMSTCGANRLILDDTAVPSPDSSGTLNYGFTIVDPNPQPRHVVAVALDVAPNDNCVLISTNLPVQQGTILEYATHAEDGALAGNGLQQNGYGGAAGSLRDTDTTLSYDDPVVPSDGVPIPNWAMMSSDPVVGGQAPVDSDGALTRDQSWTWAFQADSTFPGTGCPANATWSSFRGGIQLDAAAGVYACGRSTAPADDSLLGAGAAGYAIDGQGAVWSTYQGNPDVSTIIDSATNDDIHLKVLGVFDSPLTTREYVLWVGALSDGDDYVLELQSDGDIFFTYRSQGANLNANFQSVLPPNGAGIYTALEVFVNKRAAPLGRLQITICFNGSCMPPVTGPAAGGANSHGGQLALGGGFNNSQPMNRVWNFVGAKIGQAAKHFSPTRHALETAAIYD